MVKKVSPGSAILEESEQSLVYHFFVAAIYYVCAPGRFDAIMVEKVSTLMNANHGN